jgi:hypothetical protein
VIAVIGRQSTLQIIDGEDPAVEPLINQVRPSGHVI